MSVLRWAFSLPILINIEFKIVTSGRVDVGAHYDYGEDAIASDLSKVSTLRELADCLCIHYSTLVYFANAGRDSHYKSFQIRKRSGAPRVITAPVDILKHIQHQLSIELSAVYKPPKSVHGFVRKRDIVSNASSHAGKRWILNIDLRDFFPSIHFGRVRGVLIAPPYRIPSKIATVIARLCCYQNRLPQGAPTSPIIANMVARALDTKLRELARRYRITYTRYADDITLSGYSRVIPSSLAVFDAGTYRCSEALRTLITSCGFEVNEEKFRVQFGSMRKVVTGLVVNRHVNVRRRFVREIRAMLNAWRKHGYDAANREYQLKYWHVRTTRRTHAPAFSRVLRGKLEYLRHIKGETDLVINLFKQLAALDTSPSLQLLVDDMKRRRATLLDRLDRAVFVLESDAHAEQGTGFLVAGIGLVTCAHVVRPDTHAFHVRDPKVTYKLTQKHLDHQRDLAILHFKDYVPHPEDYLRPDPQIDLSLGTLVTLAGFANYARGASLNVKTAQISQQRRWFDHHRYNVNTGIIAGMSGGPVLNNSGNIVGIAATGSASNNSVDDPEAEHGVIPWTQVLELLDH